MRAMNSPRIVYTSHPDDTPEAELNALADVYRFLLLDHHDEQKGGVPSTAHDTKEGSVDDFRAKSIIPE